MTYPDVTIVSAARHRNGVAGEPFYAVLFDDATEGRMIASLFEVAGFGFNGGELCAVYKVEELAKGNVAFAEGNSWRGDIYAAVLRPALAEFLKAEKERV